MKIIGYGICGPGEADRYMRDTLDEFKRLCDDVVILCNNVSQKEIDVIKEYDFEFVRDRREWGAHQWQIKQDFIERDIKPRANEGDLLVCLDMDETIPKLTKEWLMQSELDAYHVFIADLWNDEEHFKLESCFWNVRIWRWNGETNFKQKPVHCGLAPEWTYHYHRHAPFVLIHRGLMEKETRERKIKRYDKYDPNAVHLDRRYYDMLKSDKAIPFDFDALSKQIEDEVATYNQTKPRKSMAKKRERFGYVRNPHGQVLDIPEKHIEKTLKRAGFEWVGWADEEQEDIEEMFEDTEVDAGQTPTYRAHPHSEGSYQRPLADEAAEVNALNDADPKPEDAAGEDLDELFEGDDSEEGITVNNENVEEIVGGAVKKLQEENETPAAPKGSTDDPANPKPDPNKKPETKVETPKKKAAANKAPAKKAAKKTSRKK